MMKIDSKKMKIDNENEKNNENENKKDLNIYNLKIYIVLKTFTKEEN